jgi:hypothetical protein
MKPSDVKYIVHRWPLIEKQMSRKDCISWLTVHKLEVPSKSACVFCPYHNKKSWQELKRQNGVDWQKAIEIDERIRKVKPPYDLYIHQSCSPLVSVDLRTPEEKGQLRLWDEECTGLCGI